MKRYEALILLIVLIILSVVILNLSDRNTRLALKEASKCKIILDHDCLEYGNCKCKE